MEYFVTKQDKKLIRKNLKETFRKNCGEFNFSYCNSMVPLEKFSDETRANIAEYFGVSLLDLAFPCTNRQIVVSWRKNGIDMVLMENGFAARQGVTIIPEEDKFLYKIYDLVSYLYDRWLISGGGCFGFFWWWLI